MVNGQVNELVSSLDRGLLYGDGLFETIAVRRGSPVFWDDHIQRLQHGCKVLGLKCPDCGLLHREVDRLIDAEEQCVVKIIVTRGMGGRGYSFDEQSPTRIIQKFPWPDYPPEYTALGIDLTLCRFRLSQQSRLAQIKHLNRLEQVLARSEWKEGYQEGLVCDTRGNIIEATSSNVFFEVDGQLITPGLENCGIAGILRQRIINYCRQQGIPLAIKNFGLTEIVRVEAMFICNSIAGIWPVKRFNAMQIPRSVMTERLMSVFNHS